MQPFDCLLTHATLLKDDGQHHPDQYVMIHDGKIALVGPMSECDDNLMAKAKTIEHCANRLITPGFIDCHTHMVHAGLRANEFRMRLNGMSYAEIARQGGGILATVTPTRHASADELLALALPRLQAMFLDGVTTVEIKSGYGLDLKTELKMLRVGRLLEQQTGLRIKTTFLGAHAVPPEFKGNTQGYVDLICHEMLPAVKEEGLADAVDVFCENIAFNLEQTEQIFQSAAALNLPVKCHAEQLTNSGATQLACEYQALSCDHIEFLSQEGVRALANTNTVAVLLPGAYYFLKEQHLPPIQALRDAGVKMAIATDCNPGSSPTTSIRLMMSMGCRFFGLTVEESLQAVTHHAACALGIEQQVGSIRPGMIADLNRWHLHDSAALCYYFGSPIAHDTMIGGRWVSPNFSMGTD